MGVGVCVHLARYLEGSSLTTGIKPFTWLSGHEYDSRYSSGRGANVHFAIFRVEMDVETKLTTSTSVVECVIRTWTSTLY